jgi:DNA-binding beta-propeller fold protein YncE
MPALMMRLAVFLTGAVVLTGCGGGASRSAGGSGDSQAAPIHVSCGATPVAARTLRPAGAAVLSLPGAPDGIASSADGRTAFVALQSGPPRIAVIERTGSSERVVRTVAVPQYASGVRVTPDGRYVIAAAGHGAIVLDAGAAISGSGPAVLGSLEAPTAVAGKGPGAAEVAVSPDSRHVFVTLEGAGEVAVFDLRAAVSSGFGSGAFLGAIPVGAGALGITNSPDGRWLYEVSESARLGVGRRRGALNVIDLSRATRDPAHALVATAPAPCAPVRVAASPNGSTVWVTARDGNALLGFSAAALRTDAAHALMSVTRVGAQPLGLAVANGGATVLVADSDLSGASRTPAGVSVVDAASSAHPKLVGSIATGRLADAISVPPAGDAALVTASDGRQVDLLPLQALR